MQRIGDMRLARAFAFPPAQRVGGCVFPVDHVHLCRAEPPAAFHGRKDRTVIDLVQFRKDLVGLLPRLRRFALSLTRSRDDGDDLVQAACERAILRAGQWQAGTRLDSWLFTMMRNIWVSEMRSTPIGAADHIYGNQLIAMVMSLPEGLSACLLLVSVEGHSYQEAADILDIPIGTVMSRMSRARQVMKELLADAKGSVKGMKVQ
jgi:RNA polymerase sigma-70 factor (ECF subfamily)